MAFKELKYVFPERSRKDNKLLLQFISDSLVLSLRFKEVIKFSLHVSLSRAGQLSISKEDKLLLEHHKRDKDGLLPSGNEESLLPEQSTEWSSRLLLKSSVVSWLLQHHNSSNATSELRFSADI